MKGTIIKDTVVLVPNKDHKNFTASGEIIEEGTVVEGQPKQIEGLRRGEKFTYKLFLTDKKQLIHLNKIKMETTEVTLGADAKQSATKIDMIPAEKFGRNKMIGLVLGGIVGFAWAKYKKHDMKKAAMYIAIGAAGGYVLGTVYDKRKKVSIQPSK